MGDRVVKNRQETSRRTLEMERKSVLFCSDPAWQLGEIRTHTLRSIVLAALMPLLIISFRVRVKGERAGLYCSVCRSAVASKPVAPSLIWFPVPKVLSPPFQNRPLVCNIIRNIYGYSLILLWCRHSRKSAGMRLAPLWLAPLSWRVSPPFHFSLVIANVYVTDNPGFMLDKLSLCFQDIIKCIL